MAIDESLFVASGMDVARFEVEERIAAPPERIFAAFATAAGFVDAFGPEREALVAHIDLAIGGRYEWLFDGAVGSNGCQVLSYLPGRMISFSWNAPPTQPAQRAKRTWVVVELAPEDGGTHVRLTHLGFGPGPAWETTRAYFEEAWPHVVATMKANLEA
ncbi:MAG: SRPBCC domain-containing protein [Myxococcota bacterium]